MVDLLGQTLDAAPHELTWKGARKLIAVRILLHAREVNFMPWSKWPDRKADRFVAPPNNTLRHDIGAWMHQVAAVGIDKPNQSAVQHICSRQRRHMSR